uniref:NADH-ubiquinone oxidoreductase chain 6 n=1 Tax=Folsomotoma octooculata TaxID=1334185 RepID=A0A059PIX6_9HEXA|nr:NADH dehydrogenase subunit 6 [Folsomotoma octooculata]AGL95080.1 NADH dehydrogenase subunit 6 [Folsomotoma octooculata]
MKLIMMSSIIISSIIMINVHPMTLMIMILTQVLLICLMNWGVNKMSWFSYVLFLIFLGGLMVLFIYITSLASNEKFNFNLNLVMTNIMWVIIATVLFFMMMKNEQYNLLSWFISLKSFNEMYSFSMSLISLMTMIYLFLTLIVVVKTASKYEGPLRNMIF